MTIAESKEPASTLSTWVLPLLDTLKHYDCPADQLLLDAGIDPDTLTQTGSRIPVDKMTALWKAAAKATDNPAIGLAVVEHVSTSHLFAFSFVVQTSNTVREALEFIVQYSAVISTAVNVELVESGDLAELVYRVPDHLPAPSHEAMDAFAGMTLQRLCKNLTVNPKDIHSTALPRPAPDQPELWQQLLPCPVTFDSDFLRLRFFKKILDYPIPTANPEIARANTAIVSQYFEEMGRDIQPQVRAQIEKMMSSGEPSLEAIAQQLNMSPRNLHRKLQAENSSFRKLIDDMRQKRAMSEIENTLKPLTQIAHDLGFHDSSSFSRAFKRWTGLSPMQYRKQKTGLTA